MAESENQNSFRELLERFTDWCREHDPIFYNSLRPGLSPEAIQAMESEFGFPLREDFKTLYAWSDGASRMSNTLARVWSGGDQMFHDSVISDWKMLNKIFSFSGPEEEAVRFLDLPPEFGGVRNWWNPQWIPFLHFVNGDCLCVDQFGSFDGVPGQVIEYVHDAPYRMVECPSLYAWLETTLGLLQMPDLHDEEEVEIYDKRRNYISKHYPGYPWIFPRLRNAE